MFIYYNNVQLMLNCLISIYTGQQPVPVGIMFHFHAGNAEMYGYSWDRIAEVIADSKLSSRP